MFFDDYDRFYRHRAQGELQWEFQTDQREIGEPLKFAYLFAEKRSGQPVASIAYVNTKDVETAKQLLAEITFQEAPAFLEFSLSEARKTHFDVQTLGGLRQYLAPFKARLVTQTATKQRQTIERRREDERLAYDSYRRRQAAAIFEALALDDRQEIEALARRAAAGIRRLARRCHGRSQKSPDRCPALRRPNPELRSVEGQLIDGLFGKSGFNIGRGF